MAEKYANLTPFGKGHMKQPIYGGAEVSPCEKYRYRLWRSWGPGSRCVWIMLNPSTANAGEDDPTIRRCMGFARRWGHDGIEVVNLFSLRSTKPDNLALATDPVGPLTNEAILSAVRSWSQVILAWGNHGGLNGRSGEVMRMILRECKPQVLLVTKLDQPGHPLYVPYEDKPFDWMTGWEIRS